MDTGIPLFFSEIEYLLLETIPLETIMRVIRIGVLLKHESTDFDLNAGFLCFSILSMFCNE